MNVISLKSDMLSVFILYVFSAFHRNRKCKLEDYLYLTF